MREASMRGSNSLSKMFQMRKINNEKETELKRILSSQQWEKFDASRDEMRQQFEERIENPARNRFQVSTERTRMY
jgi:hypothetical protein